jgi:hypothetical protein
MLPDVQTQLDLNNGADRYAHAALAASFKRESLIFVAVVFRQNVFFADLDS